MTQSLMYDARYATPVSQTFCIHNAGKVTGPLKSFPLPGSDTKFRFPLHSVSSPAIVAPSSVCHKPLTPPLSTCMNAVDCPNLDPRWLKIEPMAVRHSTFRTTSPPYFSSLKGLLLPGEDKSLQLTVFVSNTIAAPLNLRMQKLSTLLIIHTLFGQDLFLSVGGDYGAGHCSSRFMWNRDPSLLCPRTLMLRNTSIRPGSSAGPYTQVEESRGPPSRGARGRAFIAGIHEAHGLANGLRCRDCRVYPSYASNMCEVDQSPLTAIPFQDDLFIAPGDEGLAAQICEVS